MEKNLFVKEHLQKGVYCIFLKLNIFHLSQILNWAICPFSENANLQKHLLYIRVHVVKFPFYCFILKGKVQIFVNLLLFKLEQNLTEIL